jgi:APA family basic amino acid/polyamine antiporter
MWVAFAAGYSAVYQAMVVVLAGIILYAFVQAHRESTGQIPAPVDLTGGAGGRPPASQQSLPATVADQEGQS